MASGADGGAEDRRPVFVSPMAAGEAGARLVVELGRGDTVREGGGAR
jgi:hypothetical protein